MSLVTRLSGTGRFFWSGLNWTVSGHWVPALDPTPRYSTYLERQSRN